MKGIGMGHYMEEQEKFERVAGCMISCEEVLFECVRQDPLDRCEAAYSSCETQCEAADELK